MAVKKKKKVGPTLDGVIKKLLQREEQIYTNVWKEYLAKVTRTPMAGLESESGFLSMHSLSVIPHALDALEKGSHEKVVSMLTRQLERAIYDQGNSSSPVHRASQNYRLRVIAALLHDVEAAIKTYKGLPD